MRQVMRKVVLSSAMILMTFSLAHDGNAETIEKSRAGSGVIEFNKEEGFKLSEAAVKRLDVRFVLLDGRQPWRVPQAAIVKLKHSLGVYRRFDGWITLVLVSVVKKEGSFALIHSSDIQSKDEVAVSGTAFLRMTEADLNSDTVDTCSH